MDRDDGSTPTSPPSTKAPPSASPPQGIRVALLGGGLALDVAPEHESAAKRQPPAEQCHADALPGGPELGPHSAARRCRADAPRVGPKPGNLRCCNRQHQRRVHPSPSHAAPAIEQSPVRPPDAERCRADALPAGPKLRIQRRYPMLCRRCMHPRHVWPAEMRSSLA